MATIAADKGGAPAARAIQRGLIDVVCVGLLTGALILAFGQWLDNAHLNTTNGMWKSVQVEDWKADFGPPRLDPSNYLYYPLVAALCRLLDLVGVHSSQVWRQLAVISGLFSGVAAAFVYWLLRGLTGRRDIALLAVLFHVGCAFFLSLSVSNEDILPSYTMILASMAMAAVWFAAPTPGQVICVSVFFTLGWLTEWRLMFPTLPPLLLALALSQGSLIRRASLSLLFLATMVGIALLTVIIWKGHNGAVGLPYVLWTGKGLGTGYAGFSIEKLYMVASGMGEYWLGGYNLSIARLFTPDGHEWGTAFLFEMLVLGATLIVFWPRRHDPLIRTVAIVFLGTLGAGEIMNAYSQPNDPQMQINVMPWLTVAVALLVAEMARRQPRLVVPLAAILAGLPLAYNVSSFAAERGNDSHMETALRRLEAMSDPARTVYVYTGFEGIVTWQYLEWTHRWEGVCELGPAPLLAPKFKWVSMFGPIVHHPQWTKAQYEFAVRTELDCAFDKGYRVIAGELWSYRSEQLADQLNGLNAADLAPTLYSVLHSYHGKPVGSVGERGHNPYFQLTRP